MKKYYGGRNMKYKKSPLDIFLQNQIDKNKNMLKQTIDSTLQEEQACLEEIIKAIDHCKTNISKCNKLLEGKDILVVSMLSEKKIAFQDNLDIWNMFGHIQMASIEMKQYTKKISMDNDNWSRHENIKAAYTSIYETSKNIIDSTAKVIKFIVSNYPNVDCATLKDRRKELTKYRENNADTLKNIRNTISAHRDKDVTVQIVMIENVHLSDALQLISEYEHILNELGGAVSPIKQLGISRLQSVFG